MVSVSELWKAWQEGFANKYSGKVGEFLTDDFQVAMPSGRTMDKQGALDWTAAAGSPTTIDNLEVLYENDDVAVYINGANGGVAMCFYTKRDNKCSHCRIVLQAV